MSARSYQVAAAVTWSLLLFSVAVFVAAFLLPRESEARQVLRVLDRRLLVLFALEYVLRGKSSPCVEVIPPTHEHGTFGELLAGLGRRQRGDLAIGGTHGRSGIEHVNPPDDLPVEADVPLL